MKKGKYVKTPNGYKKIGNLLKTEESTKEIKLITERYDTDIKEIGEAGVAGYESTYLTNEGEEAPSQLYNFLSSLKETLPCAHHKKIRHRNIETFLDVMNKKGNFGIASGFCPSGFFHFGHKETAETLAFFQKNGGQIFMPIADVEASLRKMSKDEYMVFAADNLLDFGASGIDLDAAHVYLQSEEMRVNSLAYVLSRGLTFESTLDIYGANKMIEDFPFFVAGITQVGDIFLPQHPDFGNDHSMMVSGQDQDGHMKMTLFLVERIKDSLPGFKTLPSAFYIPHIRGLRGEKSSSSLPKTTLYLGSGLEKVNLKNRISCSLEKIEKARKEEQLDNLPPGTVDNCFKDMARYLNSFFGLSVKEVEERLPEALKEHQEKRKIVFEYALARAEGKKAEKPAFFNASEKAIVDESKRNKTKYYDIIHDKKDQLII